MEKSKPQNSNFCPWQPLCPWQEGSEDVRGSPGDGGAFRQGIQAAQQTAHPQSRVPAPVKRAAELFLSGTHKAWLWVCALCSSILTLWFQPPLPPFPTVSPTCQLPILGDLQEPGGRCTERVPSGYKKSHYNLPPKQYKFVFPFSISNRTYLPQVFVSWMLIKCPQVKKYLEINYGMDTTVAYAHFHKKLTLEGGTMSQTYHCFQYQTLTLN